MAVNTMPEKRFRYIVKNDTTLEETELAIDPKGWDGHEVGFERSEDFGLNIQNIVPLSFSGVGRSLLKGIYESKGIFGKSSTIIEKRQNDWTYAPFYHYKHDYGTYKDNLKYIEISGIEDGLAKKFDTYKDTEYEIDLPASGDKFFIDYTGANYTTSNKIQCKSGKMDEKEDIGEDYYVLKGTRAVRAYNNKVAFTDANELPYTTMTFRALQSVDIDIDIFLKLTIEADAAFTSSTPNSGTIKIMKHDANFNNESLVTPTFSPSVTYPFTPNSTSTPANNRIDVFDRTPKAKITLVVGSLYSFFYVADSSKGYNKVSVTDGGKCYIDISNEVDSVYQNAKLETFTYEWLITRLLAKIDSTATFESTVAYPNVKELLTCTPCIGNMGSSTGTGKIKTKLSDVLESFNKLKCIAIDITGSVMTISNRAALYPVLAGDSYGLPITVNNIVVEHSTQHQYNKITVGADTDDREDDDPLVYPFICKKEFSVEDTIADNELDLVNNFMLDPYAIDKYIMETLETADVKDECEFAVFACVEPKNYPNNVYVTYVSTWHDEFTSQYPGSTYAQSETQQFTTIAPCILNLKGKTYYSEGSNSRYYFYIYDIINDNYIIIKNGNLNLGEETFSIYLSKPSTYKIVLKQETDFVIGYPSYLISTDIMGYNVDGILIDYKNAPTAIYRFHDKPITNFSGDSDTIYNIPLTPKRILDRWKEYLAISVVGKDTKAIKYGTTTILKSNITSKCGWETAVVVENSDLDLTGITPVFLPTTISADTTETILTIPNFETKKYKYFSLVDEKKGKTYQGWTNSITFALAKNKGKQIMLQAKQI